MQHDASYEEIVRLVKGLPPALRRRLVEETQSEENSTASDAADLSKTREEIIRRGKERLQALRAQGKDLDFALAVQWIREARESR